MHLSLLSPFCRLCAEPQDAARLTGVSSEKGKQDHLQALLAQYVTPILLLPKDDKLCVCDTCKTRLLEWDSFIRSCQRAQEKIKGVLLKSSQHDLPNASKRSVGAASSSAASTPSPPKKKRSSNYCIARWCNKGNYQGVSLFRLPKERDRALEWLTAADRSDLKCMATLNSYYMCANHFTPNMFTNKACNQLVRTALPTLFPKAPFADKIALKAATSQVLPTQFQGVQLKSILPKLSSPNNLSPLKFTKIVINDAQKARPQRAIALHLSTQISEAKITRGDSQNLSVAHEIIPSKSSSCVGTRKNEDHTGTSHNSVPSSQASKPKSIAVSLNDKPSSHPSSSAVVDDQENGRLLYCHVKRATASEADTCGSGQMKADLSAHTSKELVLGNSAETKFRPSNASIQEQKHFLEEIESCFTTDPFNSNTLMSAQESNIPQDLKKSTMPFNKQPYQCLSAEIFYVQPQSSHQNDSYESTVGSQDFLLPHTSEKVKKSSQSLTAQSFSLRSDVPVGTSDVVQSVPTELNSPNIGLFDLPTDDIQGADNSSFINNMENLDELMDLDKYFEGR